MIKITVRNKTMTREAFLKLANIVYDKHEESQKFICVCYAEPDKLCHYCSNMESAQKTMEILNEFINYNER